jgi:maltose O-acetyltransferase
MTETEKMLAGERYVFDDELLNRWYRGKALMEQYNATPFADNEAKSAILDKFLGGKGDNVTILAPFFVDFGNFIFLGNNVFINMNCVFLDCNKITLGNNVLIAPGVHIYAVTHPTRGLDRVPFDVGFTAPVTIGNDVWIGGGSIILPGVTIGNNVTVGAGSVVTKSLPDNVLAFGNPCRIIR